MTDNQVKNINALRAFAKSICDQPLSCALHAPEEYSDYGTCFYNSALKAEKDGGRMFFGWYFGHQANDAGESYLLATHHAVWLNPEGFFIDVTPYTPEQHPLVAQNGAIIFLPDPEALPVKSPYGPAPLACKFFPIDESESLLAYITEAEITEKNQCLEIYEGKAKKETLKRFGIKSDVDQ